VGILKSCTKCFLGIMVGIKIDKFGYQKNLIQISGFDIYQKNQNTHFLYIIVVCKFFKVK